MSDDKRRTSRDTAASGDGLQREHDLEERTALFAEAVIELVKSVPATPITREIISQLVRSATSVGANFCEADEAESKKEFLYRIGVCKKESKESKFHLRMIVKAEPSARDAARTLWQEAKELTLIFAAIIRKGRGA